MLSNNNENKPLQSIQLLLLVSILIFMFTAARKSRSWNYDQNWMIYALIGCGLTAIFFLIRYFDKPKQ